MKNKKLVVARPASFAFSALVALSLSACGSDGGDSPQAVTGASNSGSASTCSAGSHMLAADFGSHVEALASSHARLAMRKLHGHVLRTLPQSTDQGKIDDNQLMPITVAMSPNDEAGLEQEISEIYRPGSPKFHQFLKPEEFRARFAPTADQVAQVTQYLEGQGLQAVSVDKNRMSCSCGRQGG